MTVLGMLAWCAAAVSLWLGARRYESAVARAYRWLAGGAALYCAGLVVQEILGGTLNPAPGLSFTDLPPLLALAAVAVGTAMLTMAEREVTSSPQEGSAGSVLPGLADGYVMAVALLVIGWSTLFSAEFHRSGERPGTFLLALVHPLADLAVLGALLPMVTTAWRRVMLPYLALIAIAVGDALAVGQRVLGGHLGVAAQLMPVVAALLLGAAPWRMTEGFGTSWTRRTASSAAATVIAVLAASVATLVVIGERPGRRAGLRDRAGRGGRRRRARAGREGLHAGQGEPGRVRNLARVQPEPARPGQPDQRRRPGLRPGRRGQVRQPGGRGLRLPAGDADRPAAARLRPPRGPARRAGLGPAGPRRLRRTAPRAFDGTRRLRPVPGPGPGRRRDVAARRVHPAALPGARRARPDAGHRARRERPGRAAPAGHPPDLP